MLEQWFSIASEQIFEPAWREFYVEKEVNDSLVEIAMQYTDAYTETIKSFANNVINPDGGTHLTGYRSALTRVINDYARKSGMLKEKEISGKYVMDYRRPNEFLDVSSAWFLVSPKLNSPMNSNVAGFADQESMETFIKEFPGESLRWDTLYNRTR